MQRSDEKAARYFFDEEKMFRQLAEESRAHIEGEIREGRIADCLPSRRPNYNISAIRQEFGVSLASLTEQLAGFFNAAKDSMLITEVRAGEIEERAGLKAGDCIVTVDGNTIKSTSELDRMLVQESSGELEIVIVLDRSERKVKVKLDQK
jgi:S1-C subfamily serine protease